MEKRAKEEEKTLEKGKVGKGTKKSSREQDKEENIVKDIHI